MQAGQLDREAQAVGGRGALLHGLRGGEELVHKGVDQGRRRGRALAGCEPVVRQRGLARPRVDPLLDQAREPLQIRNPQPGPPVLQQVPRGRDQRRRVLRQPCLGRRVVGEAPGRRQLVLRAVPRLVEGRLHERALGRSVGEPQPPQVRARHARAWAAHRVRGPIAVGDQARLLLLHHHLPAANALGPRPHSESLRVERGDRVYEVRPLQHQLPRLLEIGEGHAAVAALLLRLVVLHAHVAGRRGVPRAVMPEQGAALECVAGEAPNKRLELGRVAVESAEAVRVVVVPDGVPGAVERQREKDLLERGVADVPQGAVLLRQGAHGLPRPAAAAVGLRGVYRVEPGLVFHALRVRPVVGCLLGGGHVGQVQQPDSHGLHGVVIQLGHAALQRPEDRGAVEQGEGLVEMLREQGHARRLAARRGVRARGIRVPRAAVAPEQADVAPVRSDHVEGFAQNVADDGDVLVLGPLAVAAQDAFDEVAHERFARGAAARVGKGHWGLAGGRVDVPAGAGRLVPGPERPVEAFLPRLAKGDGPVIDARVRAHEDAVHGLMQDVPLHAEKLDVDGVRARAGLPHGQRGVHGRLDLVPRRLVHALHQPVHVGPVRGHLVLLRRGNVVIREGGPQVLRVDAPRRRAGARRAVHARGEL